MGDRERLGELIRLKAYQKQDAILSSGQRSGYYFDLKRVSLDPEGAYLTGKLLYERIRAWNRKVGGVGGLTLGADPLATAVAIVSHMARDPVPAFVVRKEAKGHGTGAWIEGESNLHREAGLIVLEDVVTTGTSSLRAIEKVQEAGFSVLGVLAVVDREEGAYENLGKRGHPLQSLFTAKEIMQTF
jgi:orotate phosphoribosyltransferase